MTPFFLRRAVLKKIEHICYGIFTFPNKWDFYLIINNYRPQLAKVTDKIKFDFKKTREDYRSFVFSLIIKGRFVSPEFTGLRIQIDYYTRLHRSINASLSLTY
jgi:hypothetical protein